MRLNKYEMQRARELAAREAERIEAATLPKRKCKLCGREFKPKRLRQIYCGVNCPALKEGRK